MFSKPFLILAIFGALASLILSEPLGPAPSVFTPDLDESDVEEVGLNQGVQMDAEGRLFFNQLFNLSAALANAPNGTALTFVPLGSILTAALSG